MKIYLVWYITPCYTDILSGVWRTKEAALNFIDSQKDKQNFSVVEHVTLD